MSEDPILPQDPLLTSDQQGEWRKIILASFFEGFEREFKDEIERGLYKTPREADILNAFSLDRTDLRLGDVNWIPAE